MVECIHFSYDRRSSVFCGCTLMFVDLNMASLIWSTCRLVSTIELLYACVLPCVVSPVSLEFVVGVVLFSLVVLFPKGIVSSLFSLDFAQYCLKSLTNQFGPLVVLPLIVVMKIGSQSPGFLFCSSSFEFVAVASISFMVVMAPFIVIIACHSPLLLFIVPCFSFSLFL